jgi:hypothetical protein
MIHRIYWAAASVVGSTDTNTRPLVLATELNATVDQRKQGVVPADADIAAGMPFGAALARDDVAGDDFLAAENLDSQGADRRNHGRCARIRLLSCEPSLKPFSSAVPIPDS